MGITVGALALGATALALLLRKKPPVLHRHRYVEVEQELSREDLIRLVEKGELTEADVEKLIGPFREVERYV